MAEGNTAPGITTEAAPTAPVAPGQPSSSQFTVPTGKVLIDQSEADNYRRYQDQVKTLRPFYDRASKSGFSRPEDFDGLDPLIKGIKSRGLTPEQAHRAFFAELGEEAAEPKSPEPRASFDAVKFQEEVDRRTDEKFAVKDHEHAIKGVPDLLSKAAKDILGKGAGEHDVDLYAAAINTKLLAMRDDPAHQSKFMYPDKHPLRDKKWAPFSAEVIAEVATVYKKQRDAAVGASKVQAAGAVRAGTTIAGPNTGSGTPDKNDRRPGGMPNKDAMLAKAEGRIAARTR